MAQALDEVRIYHNPRCSKSRETLKMLQDAGCEPVVVEYLSEVPDERTLKDLVRKLGMRPRDLVRTKEKAFAELDLDLEDDAAVIRAMVAHPILIERPIVVRGAKAVVGRPPENVKQFL